jgi:hypothetical protein
VKAAALPCAATEQTEFAGQLNNTDCSSCCPNGCADPLVDLTCNLPADPAFALSHFNLSYTNGRPVDDGTFSLICQQIDRKRPVIAQIDHLAGDNSHLLLIYGYDLPDIIAYGDPADGNCLSVRFSTFRARDAYVDPTQPSAAGTFTCTYVFDQN